MIHSSSATAMAICSTVSHVGDPVLSPTFGG
jgi:hypothetical protein